MKSASEPRGYLHVICGEYISRSRFSRADLDNLETGKAKIRWWGQEPSVELTVFEMDPRPGGRWRFQCKPVAGADHGAVGEQLRRNRAEQFEAHGEILEYVPPRLLVWSWIANWHEHPTQPTIVQWEPTPIANGTRVRVTHRVLEHEPTARKDYTAGWKGVLQLLKSFLEK